ncbi:DUF3515 domain-containing protein [Nocardiopsis listeri]|uniref:DUF3515 domain-containing protein n=1 Tax=Nocardiopsis listeri TaxID=53440 RepID=UPI00083187AE|nr:DUF3515 domain-containing protein [Nocardiopsis listeri]
MLKRYLGAAGAVVLLAAGCGQTVQMQPFEAQANTEEACAALVADLPDTLLDADRATVRPESNVMAAWGDPPIGLRCGVPRPSDLKRDSALTVVGDEDAGEETVSWLPQSGNSSTVYVSVYREAYVELSVPSAHGNPAAALAQVSELIERHLEERPDSGV